MRIFLIHLALIAIIPVSAENKFNSLKVAIDAPIYEIIKKSARIYSKPKKNSSVRIKLPKGFLIRYYEPLPHETFDRKIWTSIGFGYVLNSNIARVTVKVDRYVVPITSQTCAFSPPRNITCKATFPDDDDQDVVFDASALNGFLWGSSKCGIDEPVYRYERNFKNIRDGSGPISYIEYEFFTKKDSMKLLQFEQQSGPWECGG